jgi:hypothetical protein
MDLFILILLFFIIGALLIYLLPVLAPVFAILYIFMVIRRYLFRGHNTSESSEATYQQTYYDPLNSASNDPNVIDAEYTEEYEEDEVQ